MEVIEDFDTSLVIGDLNIFSEVTDAHHGFGFNAFNEDAGDFGADGDHHFMEDEGCGFNDVRGVIFDGLLDVAVFAEVILFIGHDEHVGVDAQDFVSEHVFEAAGDADDADEGGDTEHDAEDGDERDDRKTHSGAVKQVSESGEVLEHEQ